MDKNEIIERLERLAECAVYTVGELPFVMSLDDGIAIHEAIDMLRSQPEQQWIPCSESRPKHGVVLVTYKDGEIDLLSFPTAYRAKDIIAWMPLPEPYKEDNHD